MQQQLTATLLPLLGAEGWLTDSPRVAGYATDWTGRWHSEPLGVARPRTTAQVQAVVEAARAAGVSVVIQGGNTGLVGGAVGAGDPHLLLSTRWLRERLEVDLPRRQLRASAGFTLAEVQAEAKRHGLAYPVDLAARESATIGGTVATAAGGLRVVAFGDTAAQVVEVEFVDEHGLLQLGTGPVGAEGTTGVVVEVTLRLTEPRAPQWTALIPCVSVAAAIAMAQAVGSGVLAAELMAGWQADLVAKSAGFPSLPAAAWWLLLEGDAGLEALPDDALLAFTSRDVDRFWQYRERHTELLARRPRLLKLDTSVPVAALPAFVAEVGRVAAEVWVFGHLLVGNLHLAVPDCDDIGAVEAQLVTMMLEHGGRLAGEHGVGQAKSRFVASRVGDDPRFFNPQIRCQLDSSGRALSK